jgi:hypothetical protein
MLLLLSVTVVIIIIIIIITTTIVLYHKFKHCNTLTCPISCTMIFGYEINESLNE